jgi:hypothetical protein
MALARRSSAAQGGTEGDVNNILVFDLDRYAEGN